MEMTASSCATSRLTTPARQHSVLNMPLLVLHSIRLLFSLRSELTTPVIFGPHLIGLPGLACDRVLVCVVHSVPFVVRPIPIRCCASYSPIAFLYTRLTHVRQPAPSLI